MNLFYSVYRFNSAGPQIRVYFAKSWKPLQLECLQYSNDFLLPLIVRVMETPLYLHPIEDKENYLQLFIPKRTNNNSVEVPSVNQSFVLHSDFHEFSQVFSGVYQELINTTWSVVVSREKSYL